MSGIQMNAVLLDSGTTMPAPNVSGVKIKAILHDSDTIPEKPPSKSKVSKHSQQNNSADFSQAVIPGIPIESYNSVSDTISENPPSYSEAMKHSQQMKSANSSQDLSTLIAGYVKDTENNTNFLKEIIKMINSPEDIIKENVNLKDYFKSSERKIRSHSAGGGTSKVETFIELLINDSELSMNGIKNIWRMCFKMFMDEPSEYTDLKKKIIRKFIGLTKKSSYASFDNLVMTGLMTNHIREIEVELKRYLELNLSKEQTIGVTKIILNKQISSVTDLFKQCKPNEFTKYWCILKYSLKQYENNNKKSNKNADRIKKDILYMRRKLMQNTVIRDANKSNDDDESYIRALLKNATEYTTAMSTWVSDKVKSLFSAATEEGETTDDAVQKDHEYITAQDVFCLVQDSYGVIPPHENGEEMVEPDPIALVVFYNQHKDKIGDGMEQIIRVVIKKEMRKSYMKMYTQFYTTILEEFGELLFDNIDKNTTNNTLASLWVHVKNLNLQNKFIDFFVSKVAKINVAYVKDKDLLENRNNIIKKQQKSSEQSHREIDDIITIQQTEDKIKVYVEKIQIMEDIVKHTGDYEIISTYLEMFFNMSIPPTMEDIIKNICYGTNSKNTKLKNAFCLLNFLLECYKPELSQSQKEDESSVSNTYKRFIIKLRKSILESNLVSRKSLYTGTKELIQKRSLENVQGLFGLLMNTGREAIGTAREVGTSIMNSSMIGRITSFMGMATSSTVPMEDALKTQYDSIKVTEQQLLNLIKKTKDIIPSTKDEYDTITSFDDLSEKVTTRINRTFKRKFACVQYYNDKMKQLKGVLERLYNFKSDINGDDDKDSDKLWEYYIKRKKDKQIVVEQSFTDKEINNTLKKKMEYLESRGDTENDVLLDAVKLEMELLEVLEKEKVNEENCTTRKRRSSRRSSSGKRTQQRHDRFQREFEHYHTQEEVSLLAQKKNYINKIADISKNLDAVKQELKMKEEEARGSSYDTNTSEDSRARLKVLTKKVKTYASIKRLRRRKSQLERDLYRYQGKLAELNEDIEYQQNQLEHDLKFYSTNKTSRVDPYTAKVRDRHNLLYLQCAWNTSTIHSLNMEFGDSRGYSATGNTRKNIQSAYTGIRLKHTHKTQDSTSGARRIELFMMQQLATRGSIGYLSRKRKDDRYYLNYRISEKRVVNGTEIFVPIEIGYAGEINPPEEWWTPIGRKGPILSKNLRLNLINRWRRMLSKDSKKTRPSMEFILKHFTSSFYKAVEFCRKVMKTKENNKSQYYIDPQLSSPQNIKRSSRSVSKKITTTQRRKR